MPPFFGCISLLQVLQITHPYPSSEGIFECFPSLELIL